MLTAAPSTVVVAVVGGLGDVGVVVDVVLVFDAVDGADVARGRLFDRVDVGALFVRVLGGELDDDSGVEAIARPSTEAVVSGSGPAAELAATAGPADTT